MMGMSKKKKNAKNWFNSVKNAFKSSAPIPSTSSSKDYSLANKIIEEHETPEIVSLEHYPICDTSSLTTTIDENAEAVLEIRDEDRRRSSHAIAMAVVAAETAVLAAHEATKVSRFSSYNRRRLSSYSKEERAATKIQSHYKGYLARRALRALRGLVKLQALVRGHNVRKQAEMTMRCMQAIVRVQARTKADRLRLQESTAISHDNEKSKGKKRATETCKNSRGRQQAHNSFSFQTINEKQYSKPSQKINKHEHYLSSNSMTIKNERALAYAYPYKDLVSNHQNSDEKTHQGGWNLLDRWIDSQPWHRDKHVAALPPESSYTTRTCNTDDDNASERGTDSVSLSPSHQLRFNPVSNLTKLGINSAVSVPKQRVMVSVETENVNTPSYMAPTQSAKAKAKSAQHSLFSSSSSTRRIFLNDLSMSSSTDGIGTGTEVRTMSQLGPINSPSPTSSQKMMRLLKMGNKPIKGVR